MSTISASTTTTTAYVVTADTTGALVLQTGATPTTALTIDTSQNVTLAGTLSTTGITNTGVATATRFNPTGSSVTGNGMYLPAANSLGLSTNGTNALYIDSSQNVGISNSSPASKLDVITGSSNAILTLRAYGQTNASTNNINFWYLDVGGSPYNNASISAISANSAGDGSLAFSTRPQSGSLTERMRINSSGYVGIGDTNPQSSLAVNSTTNPQIRVAYTGVHTYGVRVTSGGNFAIQDTDASSADRLTIDSSGRVTQPYQTAFYVRKSTDITLTGTDQQVVFNTVYKNDSSAYSTSTGLFTAPITAWYLFNFTGTVVYTGSSAYNAVYVYLNGSAWSQNFRMRAYQYGAANGTYASIASSWMMYLSANDTVSLYGYSSGANTNLSGNETAWSGYLLG
jgi:hypothetical protein